MGLQTCNMFTNLMMKLTSSNFVCASGAGSSFLANTDNIATRLVGMIMQLLYFVCKWILYLVDIVFFYIRQLCGLEMDLSSLDSAISKDSDMVFNLLISNRTTTTRIVRSLIGLALALIIVFTIIAIIKSQLTSLKTDKPTDVKGAMKTAFKSLILILVTPMIALLGIVASNVLLKTLYNVTNTTNANSLSSSIFAMSATSANKYRAYAMNDKRIPITFDFSGQDEIMKYYENNTMTDKMYEYLTSSKNVIYTTAQLFGNETFSAFDDTVNNEAYYMVYDGIIGENNSGPLSQYMRIRAYKEEYMVMADMIDYAVKSCNTLYIKTVEKMLNSIVDLPEIQANEIFNDVISTYGIKFFRADDLENEIVGSPTESLFDVFFERDYDVIRFSSIYYSPDSEGEPGSSREIQYNHLKSATDEVEGAVFLMTYEKTIEIEGDNYTYLYPVTYGTKDYGTTIFESDYIRKGSLVPAKGIFSEGGYPTAIKESFDEKELLFYRDDLETIVIGDSGDILNQTYKEEDTIVSGFKGIISSISKFFKKLFNPAKLVPDISLSPEAVANTYMKTTSQINKLSDGELHISYMYNDSFSATFSGNVYGLKIYNIYEPLNINYLLLVMGSVILIKICGMAVIALIKRAYDLFMIIIIYPTACSTMPIDDGAAYKKWTSSYFGKLFSTYGLILGINFVLMLFPIIESIEFFTPQDIETNITIRRLGSLFFKIMSVNQITKFMNLFVAVFCELVAFTLLETIPDTVQGIIGVGDSLSQDNPASQMASTIGNVIHATGKITATIMGVGQVFTLVTKKGRERAKDKLMSQADKMKKYLPMSELVASAKDKKNLMDKKKAQKEAYRDLKEALDSPMTQNGESKKAEVEEKLKKLQDTQNSYTKALKDPRGDRKAEDDKKKQVKKASGSSRADGENDGEGGGESSRNYNKEMRQAKREMRKQEKKGGMSGEEQEKYDEAKEKYYGAKRDKTYNKTKSKSLDKYEQKVKEIAEKKGEEAAAAYAKRHPIKSLRATSREMERNQADAEYSMNKKGGQSAEKFGNGGSNSKPNNNSENNTSGSDESEKGGSDSGNSGADSGGSGDGGSES